MESALDGVDAVAARFDAGMTLIDRHVVATVLRHFAVALAVLLVVFTVVSLTEELRLTDDGYGIGAALWYVLWTLPEQAYELFPAAALLGAMTGLGQLASDHELTALQAAGVSPLRLGAAVLAAALVLGLLGAGLGEGIAAPISRRAHTQRALALSGGRTLNASGFWLRDGARLLNIRGVHSDGRLGEIYEFELVPGRELRRILHAHGAAPSDAGWTLADVSETVLGGDGAATSRLAAQPWEAPIDATRLHTLWRQPEELSLAELDRVTRALRAGGQQPRAYELAFWRRAVAPLATVAMVLLALPLVLTPGRQVRRGERIVIGVILGMAFQLLSQITLDLGLVAGLNAPLTALAPIALGLLAAFALFRRAGVPR
jgi:lipopolysaccharide export system permease protein